MTIPKIVLEWLDLQRKLAIEKHLYFKEMSSPEAKMESAVWLAKHEAYGDVYWKLKEIQ
jgi:hypothetical protein